MAMHLCGLIIKDMHVMVAMCLLVRYSNRKTLTDCKCNLLNMSKGRSPNEFGCLGSRYLISSIKIWRLSKNHKNFCRVVLVYYVGESNNSLPGIEFVGYMFQNLSLRAASVVGDMKLDMNR